MRNFILAIGAAAMLASSVALAAEQNEEPSEVNADAIEYEGNTIVEEKDGKILWELTCSKMVIDSVTQNAELSDVIWKFYQHEQDKVWELKSDTGIYYQAEKFIHVEGNVNVTNSDGAQVLSDKMDWYFEKQILEIGKEKFCANLHRATRRILKNFSNSPTN